MNNSNLLLGMLVIGAITSTSLFAEQKNELTIYQVMQRVLDRYPSLKIAEMEVAQAAEQRQQVESSLGWILNSTAAIAHDLNALGAPSDSLSVNGSLARQLESGSTLSLSGGYRYEDSSIPFGSFPNPANTTKLDLSYRMPLAQGKGNPLLTEGLVSADAGHDLAKASQLSTRISVAEKVKDLFYASALTDARLVTAKQAVQRAKKLEEYINKNFKLGLSEEKDKLQVKAQLQSKLAELSQIQLQWQQQKTSLNRLMLEDWDQDIQPTLVSEKDDNSYQPAELIATAKAYHPAMKISEAKLQIAESQIKSSLDTKKDNLDLVLSVGSRTSDGTNTSGTVISEQDFAGTVRLEYRHLFDDKGVSSKYKQAQVQRNIALQDMQKVNDDIHYTVSSLVAEIEAAKRAVVTSQQQLKSESLKLKEAEYRFKTARADTAQLIQFQNEYSFSELAYQQQKINYKNRIIALQIFTGQFWNKLTASPVGRGVAE